MIANKIKRGESVIGTMIGVVRNPAIASLARHAGLDFIMIDMEHRSYSFQTVGDILSALRREDLGAFLRVPHGTRGYITRGLDSGAHSIMVPRTETVQQAQLLAKWAKYPPVGERGVSSMGAHTGFKKSPDLQTHMQKANEETITIAQIETELAVEAVNDIAAVDGIDALLIGPNDLSVSLGCPGDHTHAKMDAAIEKVAAAADDAGIAFGIHSGIDLLKRWSHVPMQLLMAATDISILAAGLTRVADDLQQLGSTRQ